MRTHLRLNGTKVAVVLAASALVVAVLGATPVGHAAARLVVPKASVGAPQLKKNAITSLKVRDHSLLATDFKAGQLPAGPAGPKGDTGPAGVSGYQVVKGSVADANPGQEASSGAGCPLGTKAIGGGLSSGQPVAVINSAPDGQWWYVTVKNVGPGPTSVAAYAVCAKVS